MLYYASKTESGIVKATYSGRFIFLPWDGTGNENDFQLFMMNVTLRAWRSRPSTLDEAGIVVVHEYVHKNVFSHSPTGLMLNGMRSAVRIGFLLFRRKKPVESYYRMRTIYLMETLSYHERIAHAIEDEFSLGEQPIGDIYKTAFDSTYMGEIQDAENRITGKWEQHGLLPTGMQAKLYLFLGRIFQKKVVAKCLYHTPKTNYPRLVAFSPMSSRTDSMDREPFLRDVLNKTIRIILSMLGSPFEKLENFRVYFEWYWIGQRTQFQILRDCYQMDFPVFRDRMLCPSASFIMDWAGVPVEQRSILIEFTEDTLLLDKDAFMERWRPILKQWKVIPYFGNFLGFFHQHGN